MKNISDARKLNLLVCGGVPRAATTYLYTELANHKNVFHSLIKESYLFERPEWFIKLKLNSLRTNKIFLDFTPEYVFNSLTLNKIKKFNVSCFFILREYDEYRASLIEYLHINKMNNPYLLGVTESEFNDSIGYVKENFLSFSMKEVCANTNEILVRLENNFQFDFGERIRSIQNTNSSKRRVYYLQSFLNRYVDTPTKVLKSTLVGYL